MKKIIVLLIVCVMLCGCVVEAKDDGFVPASEYVSKNDDANVYDSLYTAIQLAICDKGIEREGLDGTVRVSKDGVSFKDVPDVLANSIMGIIKSDLDYYRTSEEYLIGVKGTEYGVSVSKAKAPE